MSRRPASAEFSRPLTKNQQLAMAKDRYIAELLAGRLISATPTGDIINENWRGTGRAKIMKATRQKGGYLYVTLPGKVTAHASRVVAIAFHGLPVEYREACHRNGIHTDNRPENLIWMTPQQNTQHSFDAGFNKPLSRVGEGNGRATLTAKNVKAVRRALARGEKPEAIARRFGVSARAIYGIRNGETWVHV